MEVKKYYTPEIEEFHVGFEYREILGDGSVLDRVFEGDEYIPVSETLRCGDIRVKHLDREDIEFFGWNIEKEESRGVYLFSIIKNNFRLYGESTLKMAYNARSRWVTIAISENNYGMLGNKEIAIFSGVIKNKSEFKRILKQIGL